MLEDRSDLRELGEARGEVGIGQRFGYGPEKLAGAISGLVGVAAAVCEPPPDPRCRTIGRMRFGYAIAYVPDVERSVEFYERAFGIQRGYIAPEGTYGELATGETKLAFVADAQAEGLFDAGYRHNDPGGEPSGFEFAFVVDDVDAAYERAISAGAAPWSPPADKPWGQRIGYVRDLDGILVEIASSQT